MDLATLPSGLQRFEKGLGAEAAPGSVHRLVRGAIESLWPWNARPVIGTALVSCSDDLCSRARTCFEKDITRTLAAASGSHGVFATSNLGARVEDGALDIALGNLPRRRSEGRIALVVGILAHVGRWRDGSRVVYGRIDRGDGQPSPCCGALSALLTWPGESESRFVASLRAAFGQRRLAGLQLIGEERRLVVCAAVHAVLQAELLAGQVLHRQFAHPTDVVVVPLVVVNERSTDGLIPVGLKHLAGGPESVLPRYGRSLRTTPAALRIEELGGRLVITSEQESPPPAAEPPGSTAEQQLAPADEPFVAEPEREQARAHARARLAASHAALDDDRRGALRLLAERLSSLRQRIGRSEVHARVWARPLLQSVWQALSLAAPELGIALFAAEGVQAFRHLQRVRELLAHGPSTQVAREALQEIEHAISHLSHEEALEVLETLSAENSPLFGR